MPKQASCAILALAAGLFLAPPALAAEVLTLDQARRDGLAHGPGLQASRVRADHAARARDLAGRLVNPDLALQSEPGKVSLDLTQRFDTAAVLGSERAAAEAALADARASDRARRAEYLASVVRAYYAAFVAQARVRLAQETAAVDQELAEIASRRHGAGDLSRFDLLQAQAAALGSLERVRAALTRRDEAQAALALLLGHAPSEAWEIARPGAEPGSPPTPEPQRSARLARAAAAARKAEADLAVARAGRWPSVGLSGGAEWTTSPGLRLGLALPLPLWSRQDQAVAVAEGEAAATAKEAEVAAAEARTRQAVAMARLEGARAREALLTERLDLLALAYKQATDGLRGGALGVAETLPPRRELLQARDEQLEALLDQGDALAELEDYRD